jgi:hypothetical protein
LTIPVSALNSSGPVEAHNRDDSGYPEAGGGPFDAVSWRGSYAHPSSAQATEVIADLMMSLALTALDRCGGGGRVNHRIYPRKEPFSSKWTTQDNIELLTSFQIALWIDSFF